MDLVVVNQNTAEGAAAVLVSSVRALRGRGLMRTVVVENASCDGSRQLLSEVRRRGQIELIVNSRPRGHGAALNQACDYLAARRRLAGGEQEEGRYVLILDSDTIVLRGDLMSDTLSVMRETRVGLLGEFQYDALADGYAHPSALILDLEQTFMNRLARFDDTGAPATSLHVRLRERGIPVVNFPIRSAGYVLHVGRGTRRAQAERQRRWLAGRTAAEQEYEPHYHGNPEGPRIHRAFLEAFRREVPELTPEALVAACLREEPLAIDVPAREETENV